MDTDSDHGTRASLSVGAEKGTSEAAAIETRGRSEHEAVRGDQQDELALEAGLCKR